MKLIIQCNLSTFVPKWAEKRISKGCLFQSCFGFYGWAFLNFLSKGELVEHWSGVYHVSSLDFTAWFTPGHIKFEEFLNRCHFNFAYLHMLYLPIWNMGMYEKCQETRIQLQKIPKSLVKWNGSDCRAWERGADRIKLVMKWRRRFGL